MQTDKLLNIVDTKCKSLVGKQRFSAESHNAIFASLQADSAAIGKDFTNGNSTQQDQHNKDILANEIPSFAL